MLCSCCGCCCCRPVRFRMKKRTNELWSRVSALAIDQREINEGKRKRIYTENYFTFVSCSVCNVMVGLARSLPLSAWVHRLDWITWFLCQSTECRAHEYADDGWWWRSGGMKDDQHSLFCVRRNSGRGIENEWKFGNGFLRATCDTIRWSCVSNRWIYVKAYCSTFGLFGRTHFYGFAMSHCQRMSLFKLNLRDRPRISWLIAFPLNSYNILCIKLITMWFITIILRRTTPLICRAGDIRWKS